MSNFQSRPTLRPSFDRALEAYRGADLIACIALLEGLDFERPTILRVRALTRLGDLSAAKRTAVDAWMQDAGDIERAEMNTIYANVAVKMQRNDVDTAFEDAAFYIEATQSQNLRAELDFIQGRHAWSLGDLDAAEVHAMAAANAGNDDATSIPHMEHVRALALELLGLIAQEHEQFDIAVKYMRDALSAYDTAPVPDAWVAAFTTSNLALLARDFPNATTSAFLADRIDRISWGTSIAVQHFFALHGLGWARAHEGDHVGALRAFHKAADATPSPALKVAAWVDHANLTRAFCSGPVAEESARYAADAANEVPWDDVADMERIVLLFAAETISTIDVRFARILLKRYEATRSAEDTISTGIIGSTNVRWRCFETRAEAAVLANEGATSRAISLFRDELSAWQRIGSGPRAAVAAADLYDLTGNDQYLREAREAIARTPRSWIAQRLNEMD